MLNSLKKIILRYTPIYQRTVLFRSFQGMYNDNPRYISESLHKLDNTINIVWALNEQKHEIPDYIKRISINSSEYVSYLSRSQVVVDNYFGIDGKIGNYVDFSKLMRRSNRLNISTWHGTPLKRIYRDELQNSKPSSIGRVSDCILAGCKYTENILKSAFCDDYPVFLSGTPRNDLLLNNDVSVDRIKRKLKLPLEKRIVMFAPTFRNSVNNSGVEQMNDINFSEFLKVLSRKFGGEWCFVFRVHNEVLNAIDVNKISEEHCGLVINGNYGEDMAEYLACTDVLITDYSGAMHDFALTRKPCFLFCPDREEYEHSERGFYMNYDSLPFPSSLNYEELIYSVKEFDNNRYVEDIERFLNDIGNIEDGKAAWRVANFIMSFINNGSKKWEVKI